MTTPDAYPGGLDPAHVARVCLAAAPTEPGTDGLVLAGGRYPVRVFLPSRKQARLAQAALARAGYDVTRPARPGRGRDLIIRGWDTGLLDARLAVMRTVIATLGADVTATAARMIDGLGHLPASALPGQARQQELARQAGRELRDWADRACGLGPGPDPRARPADTGIVLRLRAARQGREEIAALIARHVSVTSDALEAYTGLRATARHHQARDTAVGMFHGPLPATTARTGTTQLGPGTGESSPPGSDAPPAGAQWPRGAEPAQIFPAAATAAGLHALRPMADRPPGRDCRPGPRR